MEMEATQAIPLSDFDDDETDEETEQEKAPVSIQQLYFIIFFKVHICSTNTFCIYNTIMFYHSRLGKVRAFFYA